MPSTSLKNARSWDSPAYTRLRRRGQVSIRTLSTSCVETDAELVQPLGKKSSCITADLLKNETEPTPGGGGVRLQPAWGRNAHAAGLVNNSNFRRHSFSSRAWGSRPRNIFRSLPMHGTGGRNIKLPEGEKRRAMRREYRDRHVQKRGA